MNKKVGDFIYFQKIVYTQDLEKPAYMLFTNDSITIYSYPDPFVITDKSYTNKTVKINDLIRNYQVNHTDIIFTEDSSAEIVKTSNVVSLNKYNNNFMAINIYDNNTAETLHKNSY